MSSHLNRDHLKENARIQSLHVKPPQRCKRAARSEFSQIPAGTVLADSFVCQTISRAAAEKASLLLWLTPTACEHGGQQNGRELRKKKLSLSTVYIYREITCKWIKSDLFSAWCNIKYWHTVYWLCLTTQQKSDQQGELVCRGMTLSQVGLHSPDRCTSAHDSHEVY